MNKADLVAAVAAKTGLTKVAAADAINATIESIAESLKKGENVQLIGFGTFAAIKKAARKGINPLTKKVIEIPAKTVAKFKAGKGLL